MTSTNVPLGDSGRIAFVMPVHNRKNLAVPCLLALCEAISTDANSELVVVDHASTDGIREFAESLPGVTVVRSSASTAGELRNEGVAHCDGQWVCFIDSDVQVPINYVARLRHALTVTPAAIVGREYTLPAQPKWGERAWDKLNGRPGDGPRPFLNSGNIAMSRGLFVSLGGFNALLSSGEDTDLARRAMVRGIPSIQYDNLAAMHLGNPKSLTAFFFKELWHGEGARLDDLVARAAIATVAMYAVAVTLLIALLLARKPAVIVVLVGLLASQIVPAMGYLHRVWSRRRFPPPAASLLLLNVYFSARFVALFSRRRRR